MGGEQEVDRLAMLVDGAVEVAPLAANLDVGLIDPHRAAVWPTELPHPLLDQGRVGQHPPVQGGMIHLQAAFQEQLLDVAIAERVAQVPRDRLDDQGRLVVPASEVSLSPLLELGGDSGQDHGPAPKAERHAGWVWLTSRKRRAVRVCDRPLHPTQTFGPPCAHLRSGRSSAVRHLWPGVESDLADLTGSQKEAAGSWSRHRLEGCTCSEAELELRYPEPAASDKSITAEKARRGSCRAGSRGAIRDPACLQRVVPEPVDPGTAAWLALMAHNSVGKLIGAPGL